MFLILLTASIILSFTTGKSVKSMFAYIVLVCNICLDGKLEQLGGSRAVCEDDEAVFVCTNEVIGTANWRITVPGILVQVNLNFGMFLRRTLTRDGPGSSTLQGNITYINSSFIISMVTFKKAIYFNESIVDCDGSIMRYTIQHRKLLSS